jgi:hypothetical protein
MAIAARENERRDSLLARLGFEQEHGDFLHATGTGSREIPSRSTKTGHSRTNPPFSSRNTPISCTRPRPEAGKPRPEARKRAIPARIGHFRAGKPRFRASVTH